MQITTQPQTSAESQPAETMPAFDIRLHNGVVTLARVEASVRIAIRTYDDIRLVLMDLGESPTRDPDDAWLPVGFISDTGIQVLVSDPEVTVLAQILEDPSSAAGLGVEVAVEDLQCRVCSSPLDGEWSVIRGTCSDCARRLDG